MYDAIIVGARCGGSPTAMLLARKGYRVLLLERGDFPSDTISTHIIWPPGVARLEHWGLLLAALEPPPPQLQRLFAALPTNQAAADGFLGTIAGAVSIPEYFSEENQQRIVDG